MLNQCGGDWCCITGDKVIIYYEETGLAADRLEAVEQLERTSCRNTPGDVILRAKIN